MHECKKCWSQCVLYASSQWLFLILQSVDVYGKHEKSHYTYNIDNIPVLYILAHLHFNQAWRGSDKCTTVSIHSLNVL